MARLDCPARLFLCAGCRIQVILRSHCDRGNRYCGRACWRQTHDLARREAACRYQCSRAGRLRHAARSQRWRQRLALGVIDGEGADLTSRADADAAHKVLHQGSRLSVSAAPLAACTPDLASTPAEPTAGTPVYPPMRRCYRCGALQPDWLRQGFLLRGSHSVKGRTGWRTGR